MSTEEYEFIHVKDVKCINLKCEDPKSRNKLKQQLGEKFLEVPILDSKKNGDLSDIIIVTLRADKWIDEFCKIYSASKLAVRDSYITGGYQKAFYKKAKAFIYMNVYEAKNKIMVQGNGQEALHQWLQDFDNMKKKSMNGVEQIENGGLEKKLMFKETLIMKSVDQEVSIKVQELLKSKCE